MQERMIKPNLKLQNWNIDRKLPSKIVEWLSGDGPQNIIVYGRTQDIDARFPGGRDKNFDKVEQGKPDPSADIPVWPSTAELIPPQLAGAMNAATKNLKEVTGVALGSVQGMFEGLKSLAKGDAGVIIALAELDGVILETKAFLGDISGATPQQLKPGIDGEILKAGSITDPASLAKAKASGNLGEPTEIRNLASSGNLQNFNIDKTQNFRDVTETVSVRVGDDENGAVFERQEVRVRVYGDETSLTEKYGERAPEVEATIKYAKPPAPTSTLKVASISVSPAKNVRYDEVRGTYRAYNPVSNTFQNFSDVALAEAYSRGEGTST